MPNDFLNDDEEENKKDLFQDPSSYAMSPDDIQKIFNQKLQNSQWGALTNNLSNRQSFGNFALGRMNPTLSSDALTAAKNEQAISPITSKIQSLKMAQDAAQIPKLQSMMQDYQSGSPVAALQGKLLQHYAAKSGIKLNPEDVAGLNAQQMGTVLGAYQKGYNADASLALKQALAGQNQQFKEGRLDIARQNQAGKVASAYNTDPVMKATQQQLAQVGKAEQMLGAIQSGKLPFTPQVKADIEKDVANILSGGSISSLGQTERVEFNPYTARWAKLLGNIQGIPQDIGAPGYAKQLQGIIHELKGSISEIAKHRSKTLGTSFGAAYSNNPYAKDAIKANSDQYGEPEKVAGPESQPIQKPAKVPDADWAALSDDGKKRLLEHLNAR